MKTTRTLAEVLSGLAWGGAESGDYPAYAGECKSKPSAAESTATANSKEDRASANRQFGQMDSDLADVEGGAVQDTNLYKRTLTDATQDTTRAFNSARRQRSARARIAGFGYEQPIAQTDAGVTDRMEAGSLGELPTQVADMVQGYRMQAAGLREGAGSTFLGSSNQNLNLQAQLEQKRLAARRSMWSKIAKLGVTAAGIAGAPFTGGASMGAAGAINGALDD